MNNYGREFYNEDNQDLSGKYYITKDKNYKEVKRKKLFFGNEVEHVQVDVIQSSIKNNIEKYDKWIDEYVSVINQFLDNSFNINVDKKIFDIKRVYSQKSSYEDDGYTAVEGFKYDVLWAFPLGNTKTDEWHVRQNFTENVLYFVYEAEERIFDHKETRSRFFNIYLLGRQLSCEDRDEKLKRIACNNDNMALNSILNKDTIVALIESITQLQKRNELIEKLESIELFREKEEV